MMSDFVQLHLLTVYGPSNLNRDDTGRPKSAIFGGVPRLRISSQSLKRAWRDSEVFEKYLKGHLGERTKRLGIVLHKRLTDGGMAEDKAMKKARSIAAVFGKLEDEKNKDHRLIKQLAFISPEEKAAAEALADRILAGEEVNPTTNLILKRLDTAADIAMFGRMMTDEKEKNKENKDDQEKGTKNHKRARFSIEAAVQVAHAVTTHKSVSEDDYFTAIDDLVRQKSDTNNEIIDDEDTGAAHIDTQEFGAGVFYNYICVDRGLLENNLGGNRALRDSALMALGEAAATEGPRGKQNSFASRARASFIMAEKGPQGPRSLVAAFLKPLGGSDQLTDSIKQLIKFKDDMDKAYGPNADARDIMNTQTGEGSLESILRFIVS